MANYAGSLGGPVLWMATSTPVGGGGVVWHYPCLHSQIYFDFSGYSDMAIGLGRMFGFHYAENFNYPTSPPLPPSFGAGGYCLWGAFSGITSIISL